MTRDPVRELALAEQREDWAEVAAIAEHDLMDLHKAVAAWHALLERDETDLAALSELARLYRATERWAELADVLERQIELVDTHARGDVLAELATVYRDLLGDAAKAAETQRRRAEL